MSLDNFMHWVLFCAGFIMAIFAGYMFYIDKISAGAAWLALGVGFLLFATRIKRGESVQDSDSYSEKNINLHDMAILIADLAVMNLRNIGRTVTPSEKEIKDLAERVNNFLESMPVDDSERESIAEEFDRLTDRTRRNSSGRALFKKLS